MFVLISEYTCSESYWKWDWEPKGMCIFYFIRFSKLPSKGILPIQSYPQNYQVF